MALWLEKEDKQILKAIFDYETNNSFLEENLRTYFYFCPPSLFKEEGYFDFVFVT